MATLTIDQKITAAAAEFKSGQSNSKAALAKVKRLIRIKVDSAELARALDDDSQAVCP